MALRIDPASFPDPVADPTDADAGNSIVLAGGCFWCTEAVYAQLEGVLSVRPGYAGGSAATARYETVCTGTTGHAEAVRIVYDPQRITLGQILRIFFSIAHDPTQRDRQGADVGSQYRSAIFHATETQRRIAERYIARLEAAQVFDAPIVTTLEPLDQFYEAEPEHHGYAARHPGQPYIRTVAAPKVAKLRATHAGLIADDR